MTTNQHSEDLKHIRSLMEQSSKFMGLSGWSLFAAGLMALAGIAVGYFIVQTVGWISETVEIMLIAGILVCAVAAACFFMVRKAEKAGQPFWSLSAKRAFLGFCIPFITGGIFCSILIMHDGHIGGLLLPITLIFYGLALVNAAKFTIREVHYLGLCEIILGLLNVYFFGPILFWALGFGLANMVAGLIIYFKYDRT